ncbi:thioredoxin-related protein [Aureibacter tunicatorum]|uniref:Thioredoxin-related protein n=1 Tax=Aureibacter tunicatorum TaxID=866807 RepID=A0AAE3XNB5_9BACT|nr:thioredoxin-related protein [Aureibacter tunicatorum]BDD05182.1 hypothetical protein AUTU_26650 [Aureibacter tunicatorum]
MKKFLYIIHFVILILLLSCDSNSKNAELEKKFWLKAKEVKNIELLIIFFHQALMRI